MFLDDPCDSPHNFHKFSLGYNVKTCEEGLTVMYDFQITSMTSVSCFFRLRRSASAWSRNMAACAKVTSRISCTSSSNAAARAKSSGATARITNGSSEVDRLIRIILVFDGSNKFRNVRNKPLFEILLIFLARTSCNKRKDC